MLASSASLLKRQSRQRAVADRRSAIYFSTDAGSQKAADIMKDVGSQMSFANLQYRAINLEGQVKEFSNFQSEIRKQMGDIATAVELIKQTMLAMKEASPGSRMPP